LKKLKIVRFIENRVIKNRIEEMEETLWGKRKR